MSITLTTLEPHETPAPEIDRVYIDVQNYDDAEIMLKQDDDWISLDAQQIEQLRKFLDSRLPSKDT